MVFLHIIRGVYKGMASRTVSASRTGFGVKEAKATAEARKGGRIWRRSELRQGVRIALAELSRRFKGCECYRLDLSGLPGKEAVQWLPAILEDGLYDGYEAGINATTCPRYKSGAAWIPTITDSSRYAPEGRNATSPTNVGSFHTDILYPGYR